MSRLSVTFLTPEGDRTTLQVREGDSLLDIAHEHDIDLEGSLSCPFPFLPLNISSSVTPFQTSFEIFVLKSDLFTSRELTW